MSTNLLQLFPGLTYNDIRPVPFEARFTANVGDVVSGKFTWQSGSGNNGSQFAHEALKGRYYFINTVAFSSNIDQLVFSNALDSTVNNGFINFNVIKNTVLEPANKTSISFASFKDDLPLALSYTTLNDEIENINFEVTGQLDQTAEIISLGKTTIDLYVACVIYDIGNQDWVNKNFLGNHDPRNIRRGI